MRQLDNSGMAPVRCLLPGPVCLSQDHNSVDEMGPHVKALSCQIRQEHPKMDRFTSCLEHALHMLCTQLHACVICSLNQVGQRAWGLAQMTATYSQAVVWGGGGAELKQAPAQKLRYPRKTALDEVDGNMLQHILIQFETK